jgi:RNA polymerase-binding transcription factor DksA
MKLFEEETKMIDTEKYFLCEGCEQWCDVRERNYLHFVFYCNKCLEKEKDIWEK